VGVSRDLLSKLKGNRATFMVHSRNQFAAVAAAASFLGRGREAGRYFQFSEDLVPMIQTPKAVQLVSATLTADFKADWTQYLLEVGLPACGLKFKPSRTAEENTLRFLNAYNRRIPQPRPRLVRESRELSIPQEHEREYVALKEAIRLGGDLKPYLSRHIATKKRPDWNDSLLNAWGIQHLHFRPDGTLHILFCKITDSEVFAIQVFPHPRNDQRVWVQEELLEILHVNWPEEIAHGMLRGLPPDTPHDTDTRVELRGFNANFVTTTKDGTQYLAPGGGLMASGDCAEDKLNCDKIFSELKKWQAITEGSEANIRAALNWPASEPLCMRILFDNRKFCVYEPTTLTRIKFDLPAGDGTEP